MEIIHQVQVKKSRPTLWRGGIDFSFCEGWSKKPYKEPFNVGAGLKPTVLLALILIVAPVCGLRPVLALRFLTVKVPKPGYVNLFSFLIALLIASNAALKTSPANLFDKSSPLQLLTTAFTKSSLVNGPPSSKVFWNSSPE
jgi:hypothetical protein|tara:strand:- start:392 stop:814 length:423 start_codon:yes stop_codon:yes gene_type:complete